MDSKKLIFEEFLEILRDNAFVRNIYPIIVTIINNCNKQGEILEELIQNKIGDKIYYLNKSIEKLPSPNDLKNRILLRIIKSRKLSKIYIKESKETIIDNNEEDDFSDESQFIKEREEIILTHKNKTTLLNPKKFIETLYSNNQSYLKNSQNLELSVQQKEEEKNEKKSKNYESSTCSDLIENNYKIRNEIKNNSMIIEIKHNLFDKSHPIWSILTINNRKIISAFKKEPKKILDYNRNRLTYIYQKNNYCSNI